MKHFFLTLVLISSILFSGLNRIEAAVQGWTPPENYRDEDAFEKLVEETQEQEEIETAKDEMNMNDIFGDEQVFPFPPGLGN